MLLEVLTTVNEFGIVVSFLGIGSSVVEQRTLNPLAVGSNPTRCTKNIPAPLGFFCSSGSKPIDWLTWDENGRSDVWPAGRTARPGPEPEPLQW
jgi:hypothetical protein